MVINTLVSTTVLALALGTTWGLAQATPDPATPASTYAWADSCQTCHKDIYDAWAKTKHAATLDRLSSGEQEKECLGCHVTGPKTRVSDAIGKKVLNRGVQCEACHGGAAAHAADPAIRTGLVKVTPSSTCEQCHNDKSPKFKGFWYDAMKSLVHRTK